MQNAIDDDTRAVRMKTKVWDACKSVAETHTISVINVRTWFQKRDEIERAVENLSCTKQGGRFSRVSYKSKNRTPSVLTAFLNK